MNDPKPSVEDWKRCVRERLSPPGAVVVGTEKSLLFEAIDLLEATEARERQLVAALRESHKFEEGALEVCKTCRLIAAFDARAK